MATTNSINQVDSARTRVQVASGEALVMTPAVSEVSAWEYIFTYGYFRVLFVHVVLSKLILEVIMGSLW